MNKKSSTLAVLIIDMQDFFLKKFKPDIRKTLVSNQINFLEVCKKNKVPVVAVEYKTRGIFRGTTTKVLNDKIKNILDARIVKESNSAFTKTNLDKVLKDIGAKKIFIIGMNANACVQDTAISAIKRGYKVIVSKGLTACSSRNDMRLSKRNEKWYSENCLLLDGLEESLSKI